MLRQKSAAADFYKIYELEKDICHTPLSYTDKEKTGRVFADAKEKHAMRYAPYTGLAQAANRVRLKFAAMNLKNQQNGRAVILLPKYMFLSQI